MSKLHRFRSAALAALCALLLLALLPQMQAQAQEAKLVGTYGDWKAYTRGNGKDRFCYMVSTPQEATLRSRRGEIFFLVWHRPGNEEWDVVQVDIGYTFKDESEVEVRIGGTDWVLFTKGGNAWTYRPEDDAEIVKSIRQGARMTVKGTSNRNNPTIDAYSLKGTSAAHAAINRACDRPR